MRTSASLVAIVLATILQWVSAIAMADDSLDRMININIPANSRLEDALIEWGTQAGMTVMINTKTVERMLTGKVQGTISARKALQLILEGSGLSFTAEGQRILVVPISALKHSSDEVPNVDLFYESNAGRWGTSLL